MHRPGSVNGLAGISGIPRLSLAGTVEHIRSGTNSGNLRLSAGYVPLADARNGVVAALVIGADGTPEITDRAGATLAVGSLQERGGKPVPAHR